MSEEISDPGFKVVHPDGTGVQFFGISIRDYFAGGCCAAMVSTIRNDEDYHRLRSLAKSQELESVSQLFAKEAYKQADAMLVERAK